MTNVEYKLLPNESIISKNERVYHDDISGELILTNLNLIHIAVKGTFKKTYITKQYPNNQIKQALFGKNGNFDLYLINGQKSFRFWNNDTLFSDKKAEKEASRLVVAINQLISGEDVEINTSQKTAILGTEIVADTIGETLNIFKDAIGFKSKQASAEQNEKIAKKCSFCGASISGKKGQVVHCSYCDADQQL